MVKNYMNERIIYFLVSFKVIMRRRRTEYYAARRELAREEGKLKPIFYFTSLFFLIQHRALYAFQVLTQEMFRKVIKTIISLIKIIFKREFYNPVFRGFLHAWFLLPTVTI